MRVLYVDIDTLRADHLGCYGYHRDTSPNLDRVAAEGIRFERCYASDTPCLPSRTALLTGRFGIHTGVVGHGGTAADLLVDGPERGHWSSVGRTSFPGRIARAGLRTATVSSFAARHSAYHWLAGFGEAYDVGKMGLENADEVAAIARDWLRRNGERDGWFLHVHLWDPHTPYRVPAEFGDPFRDDPLPSWLTEEVRERHWRGIGPHSAQESMGFGPDAEGARRFPRQPFSIDSMAAVRRMFDGYDTGIRYADEHVGRLLNQLADLGVLDDTAVVISSDHGETLGELNVYCDHQTADEFTAHVPMIVRWPALGASGRSRVDRAFHYQVDVAATLLELLGARVPRSWDGRSFASALEAGREEGRDCVVFGQGAWTAQRAVRFDDVICISTYHDGYHAFPDVMLFDLASDPHQQIDLAPKRPDLVGEALARLEAWHGEMMRSASHPIDPMWSVVREGPLYVRGQLRDYLARLRATDRAEWAARLERAWPAEARG